LIYKYELANCYTMRLQWEIAVEHFEPLVQEEKFQVRGLCALQLATCYVMTGQKDKATALFNNMPNIAKKNATVDPIAIAQSKKFLANGGWFSAFELLFIRRDLAKMDQVMPQTLALLEAQAANTNALKPVSAEKKEAKGFAAFTKTFSSITIGNKKDNGDYTADDRAAYLMLKGCMLKSLDRGDEAVECFREVITLESLVKDKYYIPYTLYEMAESLYHKGDLKGAQDSIKKCNAFSGYDWEDPLKVRLRVTMDQLRRGGVLQEEDLQDGAEVKMTTSASSPSLSSSDSAENIPPPTPSS